MSVVTWPRSFAVLPIIHQLYFLGRIYETKLIFDLKWCAIKTAKRKSALGGKKNHWHVSHIYTKRKQRNPLSSVSSENPLVAYKNVNTKLLAPTITNLNMFEISIFYHEDGGTPLQLKIALEKSKFVWNLNSIVFLFTVSDIANLKLDFQLLKSMGC